MSRILLALPFFVLLSLTPQFAQQPDAAKPQKAKDQKEEDQTIKLTTELIEVRAVVTNKDGKPIEGLKKEDFELLENNKPQEVSFFNFTRIAARGAIVATQPKSAEDITNKGTAPPARSVLMFADTLHLAAGNLLSLRQSLRQFIDKSLTEQDMAALVTSYGSLGIGEQFTRDRRLLRYATGRLTVGPSERASAFTPYLAAMVERGDGMALQEAMRIVRLEERIDDPNFLRTLTQTRAREVLNVSAFRSRQTLLTLRATVDHLAKMPGQRLLVLFSDGFTMFDNSGSPDMSELQNVISRAVRAGVIIYSVDAAGLRPPPMMSAELGVTLNMSYASAGENEAQDGLNALAADTGGKFLRNTNDIAGAAAQALNDNEAIYTLAYYPSEEGKPNNFRKLTVRVKGHPEYKIRTQKGYTPAALAKAKTEIAKTPEQKLQQKMLEPLLAVPEIGVFAQASDFEVQGETAQATLQIFLDGKTVTLKPENDRQKFEIKIVLMIFGSNGKLVSSTADTLTGNLLPARAALFQTQGLRYLKRLTLKPDFYQIRIGAYEPVTERIGTASAILEVPDLKRKKLMLSSVMLADTLEPAQNGAVGMGVSQTAQSEPVSRIVQGITFYRRNRNFIYYFQLYSNAPEAANPEALSIHTEIWQDDKMLVATDPVPLADRIIGRDEKGLSIGSQLVLQNFPPGLYELRLTVRGKAKKTIATRTVLFGVEE